MHLCKARCCTFGFPLSFQDLDERIVKWNYEHPYKNRQRPEDGYCVHNSCDDKGCEIYDHRPSVCRTYDCREDTRIWIDFEGRVPAVFDSQGDNGA